MTAPPRFAFRTAGYRDWDLPTALRSLGAIGYDGVELCLEHPQARPEALDAHGAESIAAAAHDAGLSVASVSYHGDAEPAELRAANQLRAIALTRHFGTRVLILNASKAVPGREAQQWDEFRRCLATLLPCADDNGVLLALEPEPGHFLHSCADMRRLLDEMAHPQLKVNLDVGHAFLTDADVPASIDSLGGAIVHTHIEGMAAGVHRHLVPGAGDLDLVPVHRALQANGYSGYYTVDLFDIARAPEEFASRSLAALSTMFR